MGLHCDVGPQVFCCSGSYVLGHLPLLVPPFTCARIQRSASVYEKGGRVSPPLLEKNFNTGLALAVVPPHDAPHRPAPHRHALCRPKHTAVEIEPAFDLFLGKPRQVIILDLLHRCKGGGPREILHNM